MARQQSPDDRFDFRGGLNTSFSDDTVDANEFVSALNMRLNDEYGGLVKRAQTRKVHSDQLGAGAKVLGIHQWENPSGNKELVAICGGTFYHKEQGDTTFTSEAGSLSTTERCRFEEHRDGATIVLYIAQGSSVYKWGTTFATSVATAPDALDLKLYKGRLFGIEDTKRLHYTAVTAPEGWGDFADVETFDTDPLVALALTGSSLALLKGDTIARFTGNDQNTIEIDRESEGISPMAGCVARHTAVEVEAFFFFLSDRGPHLGTEAGVQYIGDKLEGVMKDDWQWSKVPAMALAVYNRGRKAIMLGVPEGASAVGADTFYEYSMVANAWAGKWVFPFEVCSIARYENADGSETVVGGGDDGYVRILDYRASATRLDDVSVAGVGGSAIAGDFQPGTLLFGTSRNYKSLGGEQVLSCDLGAGGALYIDWENEFGDTGTLGPIASAGAGMHQYRFRSKARGARLTLTFREETDAAWRFYGLSLVGTVGSEEV